MSPIERPATSAIACSAASIISLRKTRSRRIQGLHVLEHPRTEHRMKPAMGHQVNGTPEEFRQLVRQALDVPAEPRAWLELLEQIDVAAWSGLPRATEPKTSMRAMP
jgi:hypothetical protein